MAPARPSPVYCLHTPRLILRGWEPSDAPALTQAIAESLSELRVWMPWAANEPETIGAKVDRLRGFRAQFDRGEDFIYGLFDREGARVIGSVGMHDRIGAGAREIGYWIRSSCTCKGFATEAVGALCRVGFEILKLRRIEIHCHPLNLASAAVPRKLGFTLAVTIANGVPSETVCPRDTQIWVLTTDRYPASPAASAKVQAFNAAGTPISILKPQ